MDNVIFGIVVFFMLTVPLVLTVINTLLLITGKRLKERWSDNCDILIYLMGILLTVFYWRLLNFSEWYKILYFWSGVMMPESLYSPVFLEALPTFSVLWLTAFAGYFFLRTKRDKLPPLFAVICHSADFMGMVLAILFIFQIFGEISKSILLIYLTVLPFNYLLCSVWLIRELVFVYSGKFNAGDYKSPLLKTLFARKHRNCIKRSDIYTTNAECHYLIL